MLVLASASKSRKELLEFAGFKFDVIVSNYNERSVPIVSPQKRPLVLARAKAMAAASALENDAVVIGADTIVYCDGKKFEKPKSLNDAFKMLRALQGTIHNVFTGVCLLNVEPAKEEKIIERYAWISSCEVKISALDDLQIQGIFDEISPLNMCGGYHYPCLKAKGFIELLNGYESTMSGLPIEELAVKLDGLLGPDDYL